MHLNPVQNIEAVTGRLPHRYWRVRALMNQIGGASASAVSCAKLQFRATPGGADLASGGTPSASTIFSGSFPASNAFDNNGATFWVSSNTTGNYGTHWIEYDFGTPVYVDEISWEKRPDSFGANEGIILGAVQWSDNDSTWVSSWGFVTPPDWPTGAQTRVFTKPGNPLTKRFWRIRVTACQGGSGTIPSFVDVQFRGTPGGANLATGGQAIASRTGTYATINNAFDGSNTTFWFADTAVSTQPWIGYAFATETEIVEVALRNRNDGFGAAQGITAGTVQSSLDGVNFTDEWSFTSPATWLVSSAETRVFTRP